MAVQSMTGFARLEGQWETGSFVWEIRSVNGKGLDLRMRLPPGLEAIEAELRKIAAAGLTRGNLQINLQMSEDEDAPAFQVNETMLAQVLSLTSRLVADGHAAPPTAEGVLSIKGIIEVAGTVETPELRAERHAALLAGFSEAVARLVDARADEGAALRAVLEQRLEEITALLARAEADPSRTPAAIRDRLQIQVRELLTADDRLDDARLYQEAVLAAARADIREELDRLEAHVRSAASLLAQGGPIGRRLDFLSQEFNRESNTICSKSNATSLTAIGLEMKLAVDQFKEQVQNVE